MNEISICEFCEKEFKDAVFIFDNTVLCSMKCCRENCGVLKNYDDDEVKVVRWISDSASNT